jgi:hypothetical protein
LAGSMIGGMATAGVGVSGIESPVRSGMGLVLLLGLGSADV